MLFYVYIYKDFFYLPARVGIILVCGGINGVVLSRHSGVAPSAATRSHTRRMNPSASRCLGATSATNSINPVQPCVLVRNLI